MVRDIDDEADALFAIYCEEQAATEVDDNPYKGLFTVTVRHCDSEIFRGTGMKFSSWDKANAWARKAEHDSDYESTYRVESLDSFRSWH
ncbi:hypothetical protein ACI2KR_06680 [Pseudomonas luteola]